MEPNYAENKLKTTTIINFNSDLNNNNNKIFTGVEQQLRERLALCSAATGFSYVENCEIEFNLLS